VAKKWFIAVLLVLSLGGIIAVLYAVPMRAGEGDDAVAYVGTARNLAGGIGFYLAHNLPRAAFTHWAPMYPMILAAPAFLGMDPADSAKWINAIAFGCSIFFTGFIAWTYCRRSYMCGFLAALSILFSRDMIEIHSQALSEPPFIAFVLASMVALLSYVESGKTKYMIGTAIAISAALLTRYAGAFLLIAAFVIIALTWQDLKQRSIPLISFASALMIVILPFGAWIIHNVLVAEEALGERRVVYHPIGLQQLRSLIGYITQWFAPELVAKYLRFFVLLGLLVLVFGTVVSALRCRRQTVDVRFRSALLLAETCLVFAGVYLIFLFLIISFVDASTPLDVRLLSPIYPVAALLLVSSWVLSREVFGSRSITYGILFAMCLSIVVSNAARFVITVRHIRTNGVGFQTSWCDDAIMRYVRGLFDNAVLYSDDPSLIYYATGRSSCELPTKFSMVTTLANHEFDGQMKRLAELGTKQVVVVIFHSDWVNGPFALPPELTEKWGFHSIFHSAKGTYVLTGAS
jgi:4-amino-4-deoxy-L-arabinose transferase-like glycosyltransferase